VRGPRHRGLLGKPAASIVVTELAAARGIAGIGGRRCLNRAGEKAVEATAERLTALVDQLLGQGRREAPR